jgi:hypothetical protein
MASDIQYRHALLDDSDKVVNIASLKRESCTGHTFRCPDCGNEMYPTFGNKYEHHFRHLGDVCQKNNYLHATAEYMFMEEYTRCLDNGEPFLLELHSHVSCDRPCTERKNQVCTSYKNSTIVDLTKIYTSVRCEHRVQVDEHYRRPDILLTADNGEQLWIEIWVTHETVAEKRKDGHIVEVKITTEKDLEQIRNHKLVKTIENELAVRLFNVEFNEMGIVSKEIYSSGDCSSFKAVINKYTLLKRSSYRPTPKRHIVEDVPTIPINLDSIEWVDLGLPSGTLWAKKDYASHVGFSSTFYGYRKHMPSKKDAEELHDMCRREWNPETKTMTLIGPNGNSICFNIKEKHSSYWLNQYEEWNELGQCFHLCQDKSFYINDMPSGNPGNARLVKHAAIDIPKEPTLF